MVRLYLILVVDPGNMRGFINSSNGWRTMWKKLTNTDIDIDGGKDRKAHSSFYVLLEQLLRLI